MSVRSYTDVWCDHCENWCEWATDRGAKRAREAARKGGWHVGLPGGRDVCGLCWAEGKR